jgi:hypothetical protein
MMDPTIPRLIVLLGFGGFCLVVGICLGYAFAEWRRRGF